MSISIDESLLYLRHWPGDDRYGGLHLLFRAGNPKRGTIAGPTGDEIAWEYPQEFVSVAYREPLECVHARRFAFGGSSIKLLDPVNVELPERCLLTDQTGLFEHRRGSVRLRWLLDTVFEVPSFCVTVALLEKSRVDWGFPTINIETLKAAMEIKPTRYDVIGFYTEDGNLFGAIEFADQQADGTFSAHVIALARNNRQLQPGDRLWSRYTGQIGQTPVVAERRTFDVLDVGCGAIPPLKVEH